MNPLHKEFFTQDAVIVAQQLLGKVIRYDNCVGMIVETEAYKTDPASHAYKITPRSEIMLKTYAKWYIYFIYGMYHCLNITTNGSNSVGAVLIRALQPIDGIDTMKQRRKTNDIYSLCSGPGKLCQALNITKAFNGTDINDSIQILDYKEVSKNTIATSPRIGITNGKKLEWRFYIKENKFVS